MEIQCECGKFRARLTNFPKNTPGRLRCYCDDCQAFMHYLKRGDLLDANGGTEIIPIYPRDIIFASENDLLKCTRMNPKGMYRFSTRCCNTPVANTDPKRPWVGTHRRMFTVKHPTQLDQTLGDIRASIMGKFARGTPPPGTPDKFDFKGFVTVMPFLLKGALLGRKRPSPFFEHDLSIVTPYVLTEEERSSLLATARKAV
ncbi:MAG: DUF6151 family protein [Pseudomonadota bacterium]